MVPSFYWRIGVSFLVLVIGVIVVQSVMFSQMMRTAAFPQAPHLRAAGIAAEVGATLSRQPDPDLSTLLQQTQGRDRQRVYVVRRDGTVSGNTGEPLADDMRQSALAMMGVGSAEFHSAGWRPGDHRPRSGGGRAACHGRHAVASDGPRSRERSAGCCRFRARWCSLPRRCWRRW